MSDADIECLKDVRDVFRYALYVQYGRCSHRSADNSISCDFKLLCIFQHRSCECLFSIRESSPASRLSSPFPLPIRVHIASVRVEKRLLI